MSFFTHSEKWHGGLVVTAWESYVDALAAFEQSKLDHDSTDIHVQDHAGRRIVSTFTINPGDGPFPVLAAGLYSWCDESEEFKPMV